MKHILCAALLTFASLPPAHAEPRDFGHAVKLAKVPGIELSRKQRESFRAYRSKRAYFGAFYVVPGTDDGFWTRNFHDFDVPKPLQKRDVRSSRGAVITNFTPFSTLRALIPMPKV